jgi:hypothetical protein
MEEFTVGLALYDYIPTVFTAAGLFFIFAMIRQTAPTHSWLALLGGSMIVLGGLLKATWKLVMATGGPDYIWLSEPLFPLMAPGFLFVTIAVWAGMRGASGKPIPIWLTGFGFLIVIATFIYADIRMFVQQIERGWFFPLLLLASVSNVTLSVMLITGAVRRKRWVAAGLLFVNIAMVFALQPIAAMENMSIAMHWIEQTLTIGGAAAFAVGAYLMAGVMREEVRQSQLETAAA